MQGPISLFGNYTLLDYDLIETNANSFGGGIALELSVPNVSLCPTAGVTYTRLHEEEAGEQGTVTSTVVPVGFGIGKRMAAGENFYVTLFAVPQFLYVHTAVDVDTFGGSASVSESNNEFGAALGLRFGTSSFFAGGSVSLTTIEESDPVFNVSVGVLLGGR